MWSRELPKNGVMMTLTLNGLGKTGTPSARAWVCKPVLAPQIDKLSGCDADSAHFQIGESVGLDVLNFLLRQWNINSLHYLSGSIEFQRRYGGDRFGSTIYPIPGQYRGGLSSIRIVQDNAH